MPRCNTPPDVIRSAMGTTASLLDAQRAPGVIAPGACADRLAVDGYPLNNITQLSCGPEQYHRLLTEVVPRWLTPGHSPTSGGPPSARPTVNGSGTPATATSRVTSWEAWPKPACLSSATVAGPVSASDPPVSPCPSPSSNSASACPRPPTETAHSQHVGLPVTVIDRFAVGSAPPVRRSSTRAYLVPGNVNCFPASGWTVTRLQTSEQIVVVGVDGSPTSYTALRWALGHAGRTGGQVRAIRCLRPVAMPAWEAAVTGEPVPASAEQQVRAERELDQVVAAALVRDGAQRVAVQRTVVHGPAGPVLVAEAGGAALLVVGSHGHRRLTELAHRSVSAYWIRHASCPVVVIPPASEWGANWPRWRPGARRKRVSSPVKRWPGWGLGIPRVHPVGRRGQRRGATVEQKGRPG